MFNLQGEVLREVHTTAKESWRNVYFGYKVLDKTLKYPACHIIPDRVDYTDNGKYNIFFTVLFYYDERPKDLEYLDQVEEVEDTLEDMINALNTLDQSYGQPIVLSIDNFVGGAGGAIIQGIQVDFRISKIIDLADLE